MTVLPDRLQNIEILGLNLSLLHQSITLLSGDIFVGCLHGTLCLCSSLVDMASLTVLLRVVYQTRLISSRMYTLPATHLTLSSGMNASVLYGCWATGLPAD